MLPALPARLIPKGTGHMPGSGQMATAGMTDSTARDEPASRAERFVAVALVLLATFAFGQLVQLAAERAAEPGYDFRYYWLAGKLWADGVSPYGPIYAETAARLVIEGNVPEIWAYPPSLWLFSRLLAPFDLATAWHLWLAASLVALPAASAAIALAVPTTVPGRGTLRIPRLWIFALHLAVMCMVEFTGLALFVGQISILVYLGASLACAGFLRGRHSLAVAGLALLFLKPQIGAVVALGLILSGRSGAKAVLGAVIVTLGLCLPAMMASPLALIDWLRTLGGYDGVSYANQVFAMSGIRHLLWAYSGHDIGNLPAMAVALAAGLVVAIVDRRHRGAASGLARLIAIELLAALAFAPLHIYDFVVFGAAIPFIFALPRRAAIVFGLIGMVLCLRPSDLHIALLTGDFVPLFPGTVLANLGVAAMLAAMLVSPSAGMKNTSSPDFSGMPGR